jgi:hypothetical protein
MQNGESLIRTVYDTDFTVWAKAHAIKGKVVPFMATRITNHPFSAAGGVGFLYRLDAFSSTAIYCMLAHSGGAEMKTISL